VTSAPLDAAQRDDRFTATIEALQLQLIQVKQDTAKLDKNHRKHINYSSNNFKL
jgi:hypothetical protein